MRFATFITALGLLATATAAQAQRITYDYDKTADFSRLTRYAWVRGTELGDPINHQRVVAAVDVQLAAKGMRPVRPGELADVLVAYHATFDRDLQITGFSTGFGPYRLAGGRGVARAETILSGTLAIDVIDAASRTIVWRGTASKEIDVDAKPEARERNINKAAERIFARFPR